MELRYQVDFTVGFAGSARSNADSGPRRRFGGDKPFDVGTLEVKRALDFRETGRHRSRYYGDINDGNQLNAKGERET